MEDAIREATNGRIDGIELEGEQPLFKEKLSNGEILPAIALERLAAGFRSVINMVGDIIVRFSERYPKENYKDYSGLVLIDEIENHLHPVLQGSCHWRYQRCFQNYSSLPRHIALSRCSELRKDRSSLLYSNAVKRMLK